VLVLREDTNPFRWKTYASGLRNPIGFDWDLSTGVLYASNNGPDHLGYDQPPEYFSRLDLGSFHGMPWFQYDGARWARPVGVAVGGDGAVYFTSDFIVDALQLWWDDRKAVYSHIKQLVINIDNGPSVSSNRTQFIKRLTEFAEVNNLNIHLVHYPPYHSKYNPVERCWGILETHWNGAILNSVNTALEWIKTMTWKSNNPIVHFLDKTYERGVKLTKKEMKKYNDKVKRSMTLPRWDLVIGGTSW
jgi:hypothetical protein